MKWTHNSEVLRRFRRIPVLAVLWGGWIAAAAQSASTGAVRDVRAFGAAGDGNTLDTRAIQSAIDTCAARGGTVLLSAGRFLSGTIFMRSNVTLEIAAGATLLGSTDIRDYPVVPPPFPTNADIYHNQSLIVGIDLVNVSLVGGGTIDGQGGAFSPRPKAKPDRYKDRPNGIRLIRCRDVRVEGLTMRNSAKWMQHYLACERVSIRGITVDNNCNMNNDMLDIDGCRDVTISDCVGESDDDALTLKSTTAYPCKNVTITNCVIGSHCNALKMGTESIGGFQNIVVSNIVIRPTRHDSVIFGKRNGLGGITLTIVDGGRMDGVLINSVRIDGPQVPLFIRLGDRGRTPMPGGERPAPGILQNVTISNILASGGDSVGCSITGLPGHPVAGIVLSDIRIRFRGGAARAERAYPELPGEYPESVMFGTLPGFGINLRHARDVTLRNIDLRVEHAETRCAVDAEDVVGLDLDGVKADPPEAPEALFRLNNCANVRVRGSSPDSGTAYLLAVRGPESRNIRILDNLSNVRRVVSTTKEVRKGAIIEENPGERK